MSFTDAVSTCLNKYADFSGRARRSEYWYWALAVFLLSLVVSIIGRVIGLNWLSYIVTLATIVPGLAVTWRRLHDTGRSGGWFFIALVPLVGWIVLLVFTIQDSNPGPNQHGPNPKEPQAITG